MTAYPLAALRKLKDADVDAKASALGARTAEEASAGEHLARSEARRDGHERESRRIELEERERSGPASVDALTRLGAWRTRRRAEMQTLSGEVAALARVLEAARAATAHARDELAAAKAEVEALEKHRAKWEAEAVRVRERRAEAELEDVAQRGRRPE